MGPNLTMQNGIIQYLLNRSLLVLGFFSMTITGSNDTNLPPFCICVVLSMTNANQDEGECFMFQP